MKPSRDEIEKIARYLRRITKQMPNSIALARHLQTAYEMTDDEWLQCWRSCQSVVRMLSRKAAT